MYRLFEMGDSGNCYKVRLLFSHLGLAFERIATDILKGESRTEAFLSLNPNGRVPLLIRPDGRPLAESNAILVHLAEGSEYLPEDSYERALAFQWLFFEQYSHERFIATNRFWIHIEGSKAIHQTQIDANHAHGVAALGVMNEHLAERDFFVAKRYSIADIALYAYTHVAGEGDFDLTPFPHIQRWIEAVARQPRHIPMGA